MSLYIHVPFCRSRCNYCDFISSTYDPDTAAAFINAVTEELRAKASGKSFQTVYVGGGTPTCLEREKLERLIATIDTCCDVADECEVTMESNPDSIDPYLLYLIRSYRPNRLSIGVQSFQDKFLTTLGRRHTVEQSYRAIELARDAGFQCVGIDLIYGVPGEKTADWEDDITTACRCRPEHISAYCLSYEQGTKMEQMAASGMVRPLPEETLREMMELAIIRLTEAGYIHYEISNYARPGFACRHNIRYWENKPYVGVGPSAVSFVDGVRSQNVTGIEEYISMVRAGQSPVGFTEILTSKKRARETLILGLRMRDGIEVEEFQRRTGFDVMELCGKELSQFQKLGFVELAEGWLRLTHAGVFVADSILSELV